MPPRPGLHLITCALGALLAASLMAPVPAEAARKARKSDAAQIEVSGGKAADKKRGSKIELRGGAETAAERDRRLRRECRGRPNAGACLGYAY
jgi:hypothetical protein